MFGFCFVLVALVCYIITVALLVGFQFVCCFGFLGWRAVLVLCLVVAFCVCGVVVLFGVAGFGFLVCVFGFGLCCVVRGFCW